MNTGITLSGLLYLLLSAILYGSLGIFIRSLEEMFGNFTQVFLRIFIAFIFLTLFLMARKINIKIPRKYLKKVLIFSISLPLTLIFFTIAVNSSKIVNVIVMLYVGNILISTLLGWLILKERVTFLKILSIIIAFIGLFQFFSISNISIGLVFGFLTGVFEAIGNFLRKDLKMIRSSVLMTYQYLIGGLVSLILVIGSGEVMFKEVNIGLIILLIIFSLIIVLLNGLLFLGFQKFDMHAGSIILSSEIFFASLLSIIFLTEYPTLREFMGGLIVFLAISISILDKFRIKISN